MPHNQQIYKQDYTKKNTRKYKKEEEEEKKSPSGNKYPVCSLRLHCRKETLTGKRVAVRILNFCKQATRINKALINKRVGERRGGAVSRKAYKKSCCSFCGFFFSQRNFFNKKINSSWFWARGRSFELFRYVCDLGLHAGRGTRDPLGPVGHVGVRRGAGPLVGGARGGGQKGVVGHLDLVVGGVVHGAGVAVLGGRGEELGAGH